MNQSQRESILATHEDDALDKYLDNGDRCEVCLMGEVYMKYLCQSCYEDACEQAEMMAEDQEDR